MSTYVIHCISTAAGSGDEICGHCSLFFTIYFIDDNKHESKPGMFSWCKYPEGTNYTTLQFTLWSSLTGSRLDFLNEDTPNSDQIRATAEPTGLYKFHKTHLKHVHYGC